jgi:PncC family amidohydrolase
MISLSLPVEGTGKLMANVEEEVLARMTERGQTLAVAETTVGGMISARIIAVPGASRVYVAGIIPYRGTAKSQVLGVPPEATAAGGVSAAMALAMAQRARELFGTDFAVAETGAAGPGGTRAGLVFIAVAGPNGFERVEERHFEGDRQAVQSQITDTALGLLLQTLS